MGEGKVKQKDLQSI